MRSIIAFIVTSAFAANVTAQDNAEIPGNIRGLLSKNMCNTCHQLDEKLIGPSYKQLAETGLPAGEIAKLIVEPEPSNWPDYPPMAPMPFLDEKEVQKIAEWIVSLRE